MTDSEIYDRNYFISDKFFNLITKKSKENGEKINHGQLHNDGCKTERKVPKIPIHCWS